MSHGKSKTWRVIKRFPAILLVPAFTFWTFGPSDKPVSSSCWGKLGQRFKCKNNRISISFALTWLNILITIIGLLTSNFVFSGNFVQGLFSKIRWSLFGNFIQDLFSKISWSLLIIAIILALLLQFLDYCKDCCCSRCCFPLKKLTSLDTRNNEVIEM